MICWPGHPEFDRQMDAHETVVDVPPRLPETWYLARESWVMPLHGIGTLGGAVNRAYRTLDATERAGVRVCTGPRGVTSPHDGRLVLHKRFR